jgi:ribosomal protein L7Ae-like RNA K-turn-binding protein
MSRRPRLHQKQILRLDTTLSLPKSRVDSPDALVSLLQSLHRANHLSVGINSVGRSLIRSEVAVLLFAADVNPPGLVEHLLQIAAQSKVPVIPTGLAAAVLGKALGLRSAAVAGVLPAAGPDVISVLEPFTTPLPTPTLPFLRVETDFFTAQS